MEDGNKKDIKDISVINVNCIQDCGEAARSCRTCLPKELIRNGGFEQEGVFTRFADWQESSVFNIDIGANVNTYEGTLSASFSSEQSPAASIKTVRLSQNVIVTPGCFLAMSFADNFLQAGNGFQDLDVRARVFFNNGSPTNLINIEIDYTVTQAGNGFVLHQKVSDHPVPFDVTSVTVEFFVQIRDIATTNDTTWLLDGVSLRAV